MYKLLLSKDAKKDLSIMRRAEQVTFESVEDLESLNVKSEDVRENLGQSDSKKKELTFRIDPADIKIYPAPKGYEYLHIEGCKPLTPRSVPQLPVKTLEVRLDREHVVHGVKIVEGKFSKLSREIDIVPAPGNDPYKILYDPDKEIYKQDTFYPGNWVTYEAGDDNDHKCVFIRVFPVQYVPSEREVYVLTNAKVVLYHGREDSGGADSPKVSPKNSSHEAKKHGTVFTDAVNIIICPRSLQRAARQLSSFHNASGTRSAVGTTEEIASNYAPAEEPPYTGYKDEKFYGREKLKTYYKYDLARRIISYLRDMSMHPNAEYVTLMGDASFIPPSYYAMELSTRETHQGWVRTDFFYASPDYDLVPNFKVGRLPVNNGEEAMHVVNKIKQWYENADWSWFHNVCLGGGSSHPCIYKHGEETISKPVRQGYFEGMNVRMFTESKGTLNEQEIKPFFSEGGVGFVYIVEHGYFPFSAEKREELMQYSPQANLPVLVHIGCTAGSFDVDEFNMALWGVDLKMKSLGERVLLSKAGGIAFFGSTGAASGYPHIYFEHGKVRVAHLNYLAGILTGVFGTYHQGKDRLGDLYHGALTSFVADNYIAGDVDSVRAMLIFTLLGDPALKIPVKPARYRQVEKQAVSVEPP